MKNWIYVRLSFCLFLMSLLMLNCKKTESDFTQKSKQNSTISVAAAANLRDVLEELKQIYMNENPDKKV